MKTRSRSLSFLFSIAILFFIGCAQTHLTSSSLMPKGDRNNRIMVSVFENDTDTPQAGVRAANIVEGVLLAKGYCILRDENTKKTKSETKATLLIQQQTRYLLSGDVNEWRYKTGIDGEPAVSLQLRLTDLQQNKIVWSATGAKSSWGNDSIGTVAHDLVISMIDEK